MGPLILPDFSRLYVDTNTVIYHVERLEPYRSAALPVWDALEGGRCIVLTSELTLLEVLVKPFREGDATLVSLYREVLLQTRGLSLLWIDRETLELAATLRAEHRLKTPDAIHAATALRSGSSHFLTNDVAFRKVAGLNVVFLGDIIGPRAALGDAQAP